MEPALKFVPEHLLSTMLLCKKCKTSFAPNWLRAREHQMGSIQTGDSVLVRLSAFETCPSCGELVAIPVPVVERRAIVPLFGDEAVRVLNDQRATLYTYSLIGTSKPLLARIESDIRELKRKICPSLNPEDWKIHMTVLWSGQQRRKRPEFANWGKRQISELIDGLAAIIKSAGDTLFKYNIVLIGQPTAETNSRRFEEYVRNEAYVLLLAHVVNAITSLGGQPIFHFDSQKRANADLVIHQWARDTFQSSQMNLLYSFISHSIFVPEPLFVPPASHPLLEVADFMSFIVARHHFCLSKGTQPDVDIRCLGDVWYMTLSQKGADLLFRKSVGFPWSMQYPSMNNRH